MTGAHAVSHPPHWAQGLLRAAIPCDPMRDAIIGDLHEEFVREAAAVGLRTARARYWRRAVGIVLRAAWDSLCWRTWESTLGPESRCPQTAASPLTPGVGSADGVLGRWRLIGGAVVMGALTLGLLTLAIAFSTTLFVAAHGRTQEGSVLYSALGVGSLLALVACAGAAVVVLCAAPRRRGRITRKR